MAQRTDLRQAEIEDVGARPTDHELIDEVEPPMEKFSDGRRYQSFGAIVMTLLLVALVAVVLVAILV
jgi:hypothetical protein